MAHTLRTLLLLSIKSVRRNVAGVGFGEGSFETGFASIGRFDLVPM